jgi:RNA polymerase sigma-32 factor
MALTSLPVIHSDSGLVRYLQQINQFPILSEQEEYSLARKWHINQDLEAAHVLITSHLRLVAKLALKFNGYGLPMTDIISEGNLGLMHALKKFNPESGNRFSTYAMWWIKAYIQDYILKSWSAVKVGTSAVKKKLFYNLNKVRGKLASNKNNDVDSAQMIADELDVSAQEVRDMQNVLSSPQLSLNQAAYDEDDSEMIELVADPNPNQEVLLLEYDDYSKKRRKLKDAIHSLSEREQEIINSRVLAEKPATLEVLSNKFGVSCERIRQIEEKALNKIKTLVQEDTR